MLCSMASWPLDWKLAYIYVSDVSKIVFNLEQKDILYSWLPSFVNLIKTLARTMPCSHLNSTICSNSIWIQLMVLVLNIRDSVVCCPLHILTKLEFNFSIWLELRVKFEIGWNPRPKLNFAELKWKPEKVSIFLFFLVNVIMVICIYGYFKSRYIDAKHMTTGL